MIAQRLLLSLIAISLAFGASPATGAERGKDGIGFYTAVLGQASVTHPGEDRVLPVKLHDEVWFKDVIQTQNESRTKALFQDDSMLTVGENSRVEIDEYIYNPEKNVRQAIVKLMQGQVRALVSKVFKANGSRFEIHTPSAVAAARGTYFTVWVENGQSGIINIGEKGRVDFTSGGTTISVDPGFFSVAQAGHAPSIPVEHHLGLNENGQSGLTMKSTEKAASKPVMIHDQGPNVIHPFEKAELTLASSPAGLTRALAAVERTTLREALLAESPAQVLKALNLNARLMKALTALTGLSVESLSGNIGGTATVATGTLTTGALTVGSVSVGSTTVAPVAPVISAVVAPVAPIITTVVAPVAPIISPVVAPVTPLVNTILAIPPAVINGALNLLK
jgi:FecR-like protein